MTEYNKLEASHEKLETDFRFLQSDKLELEKQNVEYEVSIDSLNVENKRLQMQTDELNENVLGLQGRLDKHIKEKESYITEYNKLETLNKKLETDFQILQSGKLELEKQTIEHE